MVVVIGCLVDHRADDDRAEDAERRLRTGAHSLLRGRRIEVVVLRPFGGTLRGRRVERVLVVLAIRQHHQLFGRRHQHRCRRLVQFGLALDDGPAGPAFVDLAVDPAVAAAPDVADVGPEAHVFAVDDPLAGYYTP